MRGNPRKLSSAEGWLSEGQPTQIESCEFPEDVRYDSEGLMWARQDGADVKVGITAIHAALAGKLTSITSKPIGAEYARGRVIGAIEGGRYFGTLKTPVSGVLVAVNGAVVERPKLLSEEPYGGGWFARLRPTRFLEGWESLLRLDDAKPLLESQISALRVRCFGAFPDYEMYEIGTECAAVLVKLNELVARIPVGEVVHIVSDDWTAPIEMDRWSSETGQPVVDSRKEGNLYHFLVRKLR